MSPQASRQRWSLLSSAVLLLTAVAACGTGGNATGAAPTCGAGATVPAATAPATPGVVRPAGWGSQWLPALAAARSGRAPARVAVVGDSVGEGLYASDLSRTSWPALVEARLQDGGTDGRSADGGSGFEGMQRSQTFLDGFPDGAAEHYRATADNAWTQTGGWRTPQWPYGPAYGALVGTDPGSTVTVPFSGSTGSIWYIDRGSPWTYSLDGGPRRRVAPAGTSAPEQLTLSGLGPGRHTVVITADGTDGPWLSGVEGANPRGVRLDNFSIAGLESGAWNNEDRWRSGELVGGTRAPADLVIYELGGNDALKAVRPVSAATTAGVVAVPGLGWQLTDIGRLVTGDGIPPGTTVTAYAPGSSTATLSNAPTESAGTVELVVTNQDVVAGWRRNVEGYLAGLERRPDGVPRPDLVFLWAPASATPEVEERYEGLKSAGLAVATALGAAFVDVQASTGQPWTAWCQAGQAGNENDPSRSGADGAHPSDAGHRYIADLVLSMIDGSPAG
jgi:lysophospholipase L1-like esterase